jgi:CheY-like chemotaxis protein
MVPKILLVDDVTMFLELQKMFLKLTSARLLTAKNGEEAIEVVRQERPELVFMDLHMPVMGGAECCARLKADPEFKTLPIVMLTSEGKTEERDICRKADRCFYIPGSRNTPETASLHFCPALPCEAP